MRAAVRPYRLQDLERAVGTQPVPRLAEVLGMTPRNVQRRKHMGLDEWEADRLAVAYDLHPAAVWPEWV